MKFIDLRKLLKKFNLKYLSLNILYKTYYYSIKFFQFYIFFYIINMSSFTNININIKSKIHKFNLL